MKNVSFAKFDKVTDIDRPLCSYNPTKGFQAIVNMTSRYLRPILALKTPFKSFQRFRAGGPGEFREIPYYGFAPKYRDEFAKLKSEYFAEVSIVYN